MKKRVLSLILALALCLGLTVPALAAEYTVTQAVPCKYDDARGFSEGLAAVNTGGLYEGKWGFIDKTGKEVVPCRYDSVYDFSEGLAAVELDGQWGYIDKTGQEVIPCRYTRNVSGFSEGLAVVQDENFLHGYIDKTGKEVIPCQYGYALDFSEGLAAVELGDKCGYIDKTGKEIIPCRYDTAYNFSEGLAAVELDGQWGFVDKTGKEVIPCQYNQADYFSEGLAAVVAGEDYNFGYIDKTGKLVIPCRYGSSPNDTMAFCEGIAAVGTEDGDYGFIDKTGKEVTPFRYVNVGRFSEGLAVVVDENGKYGFIDKTGKEAVPCQYEEIQSMSEGLAVVCGKDGKYGFISVKAGSTAPTTPPVTAAPGTASPSTQTVNVDGKNVEFAMYALKVGTGSVNYIRVRDLAAILNGTQAQFEVGWNGSVTLTGKTPYTGASDKAPFSSDMPYTDYTAPTYVDGKAVHLEAIQMEYNGGGFTYYKLRDLGEALGFNVGWSAGKGIFVETDKPYNPAD